MLSHTKTWISLCVSLKTFLFFKSVRFKVPGLLAGFFTYVWLQRHSHGRIMHLSEATAKTLEKHFFFPFDLIFFLLLPLVCTLAHRKRLLNTSCRLPSSSTVRHTQTLPLTLFASIPWNFLYDAQILNSHPHNEIFCCFRCWPSMEEEWAAMPITSPSIKRSGTSQTLTVWHEENPSF